MVPFKHLYTLIAFYEDCVFCGNPSCSREISIQTGETDLYYESIELRKGLCLDCLLQLEKELALSQDIPARKRNLCSEIIIIDMKPKTIQEGHQEILNGWFTHIELSTRGPLVDKLRRILFEREGVLDKQYIDQ